MPEKEIAEKILEALAHHNVCEYKKIDGKVREEQMANQKRTGSRGRRMGSTGGQRGRYDIRKRKRVLTVSNFLLALVGFLFIFSFSVVVTMNLRGIYYLDVRLLKLESSVGLSEQEILEEYDTLIDYNQLGGPDELEFKHFPMSEHGRIHFAEVKNIFVALQILCGVSGIILLIELLRKFHHRDYGSLKLMSALTLLALAALGIFAVTRWDTFFVTFHHIFFQNDYWLFDPQTDPVINILPDVFFFHCAIAILLIMLLCCLLCSRLYRRLSRRE